MKLGFCFLITDDFYYHDHVWDVFFHGIPQSNYEVFVHCKPEFLKKLSKKYSHFTFLDHPINTGWGASSLVYATEMLLEKSFSSKCDFSLFLSSNMIPLKNFRYMLDSYNSSFFQEVKFENAFGFTYLMHWEERHQKLNASLKKLFPYPKSFLKQNMFFGIKKEDFLKIKTSSLGIKDFESSEFLDEHYWINQFKLNNIPYINKNFYISGDNPYETQSRPWVLDESTFLLSNYWLNYDFIRKVEHINPEVLIKLYSTYTMGKNSFT